MNQHATSNIPHYDAKTFQYLQSHKIFSLFESLLLSLVVNKPEDPSVFMLEQLHSIVPIKVVEDDVIDLAGHNQEVLKTIGSLASHGPSPTPSFFALFATPSNPFLPGVNEEFKDEIGELEFQQEQLGDLVVTEEEVDVHETIEEQTKEQPSEHKDRGGEELDTTDKDTTEIIPIYTTHPIEPPITKSTKPKNEELNESERQSIETLNDDDRPLKVYKPRRRFNQSNTSEEAPHDQIEDNGRGEVATDSEVEFAVSKLKRGKRSSRDKAKQKDSEQQDAIPDRSAVEQIEPLSTDGGNPSDNNLTITASYTINSINSINPTPGNNINNLFVTTNSTLITTDGTTPKSVAHQSLDKSQLPTVGSVKQTTIGEEPEPPKPKPNKFESNSLSKLRYQPQQLPHLFQPIRLQKSDYEQQKTESQLQQQPIQHSQPPLQRPQPPQQQPTQPDAPQLLLHNQLYPQTSEAIPRSLYPNIDSQQRYPQIMQAQNSQQNHRRISLQQMTATQNSPPQNIKYVPTQSPQTQTTALQTHQHYLPASNHLVYDQPTPQQLNYHYIPTNMPLAFSSLQSSNNPQPQHLPKLVSPLSNSSEVPKETISTLHLPPLLESSMPPAENTHYSSLQQLPHITAHNQFAAPQRHPATHLNEPQHTLPDISIPHKSLSPQKQLPQAVNTSHYQSFPLRDTNITQEDPFLNSRLSPDVNLLLPQSLHYAPSDLSKYQPPLPLHLGTPLAHTHGTHDPVQLAGFPIHSAPPLQETSILPSSWTPDKEQDEGGSVGENLVVTAANVELHRSVHDITTTIDAAPPRPFQSIIPFHGVHYHTPSRPRSPHSRKKHTPSVTSSGTSSITSGTSPMQLNAHTQCNHAHHHHHRPHPNTKITHLFEST